MPMKLWAVVAVAAAYAGAAGRRAGAAPKLFVKSLFERASARFLTDLYPYPLLRICIYGTTITLS